MFSEARLAVHVAILSRAETAPQLFTRTTRQSPRAGGQECAYLMMADTLVILLKKSNSRW